MAVSSPQDPRLRGFRSRAAVEIVHALIDERILRLGSETVPIAQSCGRVLAEPIVASWSVPPFDRAAMDGYALRGEETFGASVYTPAPFRVIGRSRPGMPFSGQVHPGEAVAIATGAPIPHGADSVAKVESSRLDGDLVAIVEPTPPRRHVGFAGEDVAAGATVFRPGRVLRPQDLGILSALGRSVVTAETKPPRATIRRSP